MSNTTDVTDGKPIAVWSQSISGVNAINPYTKSMEERKRCYSCSLSHIPHETRTNTLKIFVMQQSSATSHFEPLHRDLIQNKYVKKKDFKKY
jgi:hypothetical protein